MMKMFCRMLSLLAVLVLAVSVCAAESSDETVALVNGEPLMYSDYYAIESTYLYQYEAAGLDINDPTLASYVKDLALTYAIEQMLVVQDTRAQGFYELDAETEAWCVEQGTASYEQALVDVGEMLREALEFDASVDMTEFALDYAAKLNVTVDTYIEEYRTQYAFVKYQEWLVRENPVTDADVQTAYDVYVAQSEQRFADDISAFEMAMYKGEEIWYMPAGYRMIQLLTLDADAKGANDAARLAGAQAKVDEICARMAKGESFDSLYALYSADENPVTEAYCVHPESVLYEKALIAGAFSDEMTAPGSCKAIVLGNAVVLLYYQADAVAGPVSLTEEIHDALAYTIYTERTQTALQARIDELAQNAKVVIY